jgi:superfamily I DNA/RNA helicase
MSLSFEMNRGSLKISTIHSFKGWESNVVILILDQINTSNESLDELIYTGISRSAEQLFIINLGDQYHGQIIKKIVDIVNS